jgi:hypothetical protein
LKTFGFCVAACENHDNVATLNRKVIVDGCQVNCKRAFLPFDEHREFHKQLDIIVPSRDDMGEMFLVRVFFGRMFMTVIAASKGEGDE